MGGNVIYSREALTDIYEWAKRKITNKQSKQAKTRSASGFGACLGFVQTVRLGLGRVDAVVAGRLDNVVSQERVAANKGAVAKVARPGHHKVLRVLVPLQIVHTAESLPRALITHEAASGM